MLCAQVVALEEKQRPNSYDGHSPGWPCTFSHLSPPSKHCLWRHMPPCLASVAPSWAFQNVSINKKDSFDIQKKKRTSHLLKCIASRTINLINHLIYHQRVPKKNVRGWRQALEEGEVERERGPCLLSTQYFLGIFWLLTCLCSTILPGGFVFYFLVLQ